MIKELRITDPKDTYVKWWPKVKNLKTRRVFKFKPGLNILWSPNGTGKTSILRQLSGYLHCNQGGRSVVTQASVQEASMLGKGKKKKGSPFKSFTVPHGVKVTFDGLSVVNFDPHHEIGRIGGSFDYDFMTEGVADIYAHGSEGQMALFRLQQLIENSTREIEWRINKNHCNSTWAAWLEEIEKQLEASCEEGPPTIIMDEPDGALDWHNKKMLWDWIWKAKDHLQIIMATHSIFALRSPKGTNWLELVKGYKEQSLESVKAAGLWSEE